MGNPLPKTKKKGKEREKCENRTNGTYYPHHTEAYSGEGVNLESPSPVLEKNEKRSDVTTQSLTIFPSH